jgi:predicted N-acetyltransferase YhbS
LPVVSSPGEPVDLAGGLVLRCATELDVESIFDLALSAFGASDAPSLRDHLQGADRDITDWAVVVEGDRVVSTCVLFSTSLSLDGLAIDVGHIENVVTDPDHQRQGLVRALMDWQHRRSAARGHVAQMIGGIPYLYRRFGYGYGISHPDLFLLGPQVIGPALRRDPGIELRPAIVDDVPDLVALERLRPAHQLRIERDERHWRRWITMASTGAPHEHFVVARRDGRLVGWASLTRQTDAHRVVLVPAVTTDADVTDAIVAFALELATTAASVGRGVAVIGYDAPGTVHGARVRQLGTPIPFGLGVYVRIADPLRCLRALRPLLSNRLSASPFASASGSVMISLYDTAVAIAYDHGTVTTIDPAARMEDPFEAAECGVAPDWFPALVLGRWGARELERRVDDVLLGRHSDLLEVLFPRIDADIAADL